MKKVILIVAMLLASSVLYSYVISDCWPIRRQIEMCSGDTVTEMTFYGYDSVEVKEIIIRGYGDKYRGHDRLVISHIMYHRR